MSSETKSRAGLVAKWRDAMTHPATEHGAYTRCADELEAAESSSSADTGGREAYRRGVSGAIEIIRAYKLPPSSSLVRETANELIETIARDIEAHLESAEAYANCGPTRGADPGTTGAEGLRAALEKLKSYNEDILAGRINYRPKDHIAVAATALAATQRAPVTPPRSQCAVLGEAHPKTWAEYRKCCLATYGGGYHKDHEREIFHHGIETVFNLLEAEFPQPAPAPVTTPGRDFSDERDIQAGANKRRILDRRSDQFICYTYGWLDALAAAKEPRG